MKPRKTPCCPNPLGSSRALEFGPLALLLCLLASVPARAGSTIEPTGKFGVSGCVDGGQLRLVYEVGLGP
jgi:hypothetical protein